MTLTFEAKLVSCADAIDGEILQVIFDTISESQDENERSTPYVLISRNFEFPDSVTVEWHDGSDYDGHRIFVVEEDAVFPISQKTFTELYSGKVGALPKFAGQTVQIAVTVYTVQQRKPKTIIQIDCERIRILGDGTIDENYEHEGLHLAANRMWLSEANPKSSDNVVDAKARFEERLWDQRHPNLSGPSHKRILNALFK